MEEESFIDAFGDMPTDLAGDYDQLYIFDAEDFGEWYRRVRDAHEREVDGGVAGMTDAELAEHGLCRIGSAAEDNERPDSWERIARDIEEPAFSDCEDTRRERREIAKRIRKMAKKEDK